MPAIFISYRRHDSEGEAGRLFDDLVEQFGEPSIFMDVAALEPGRDFRKAIDHSVATCDAMLALIGPGWLDERDEDGKRRLDDPGDFVRAETAAALKRDIPVIPVLVREAKMPRGDELPDDLKDLAYRNCVELTHVRWKSDFKVLVDGLHELFTSAGGVVTISGGSPRTTKTIVIPPESRAKPNDTTAKDKTGTAAEVPGPASFNAEVTTSITKELTRYIGPIAQVVVRRAAKKCTTVTELCRTVAAEIEGDEERTRFLHDCQSG